MADLPEVNEWPEGIYQLETSDPVLGGPEGIDNLQGKQLANRTKWLRDQLDRIANGLTAVGQASKLATARALKFKGAATGSGNFDGSSDTEITLTLANSGVVAGSWSKVTVDSKGLVTAGAALSAADIPLGVTPPQFDNSTSYSTTEFVQRALGNFAGASNVLVSRILTVADIGKLIWFGTAGNVVLTLPEPLSLGLPLGASFNLFTTTAPGTLSVSGGAGIQDQSGIVVTSFNIKTGQSLRIVAISNTQWLITDSTAGLGKNADFAASLGANGYVKHPSGFILQWGTASIVGIAGNGFSFPIAFPNACLKVIGTVADVASGTDFVTFHPNYAAAGASARNSSSATRTVVYFAVGL
ncbi:Prophage tail fiber protein [Pseudomonas chlororaphis subsp. aureofaciens]|uniref:gp53-like domain-containing protein n=1 Tax=Pseudomonas chlororaphis TaxID=587753 RepID=UPI000F585BDE|nr:hypothetical protein [Pseudomonas chlororaphis]AZE35216.1 Prophage tail fiber protein [Pseudomonas chlororaphis subsp. aureofaciens]